MSAAVDTTGTIAALDESAGEADVIVDGASPCARCAEGRGCGAGIFTGRDGQQHLRLTVPDGMSLAVGDTVTVSMQGRTLLVASALAYGLPLAGLLGGALIAALLSVSEGIALMFAGAGLAAGIVLGRRRLSAACWRAETHVRLNRQGVN